MKIAVVSDLHLEFREKGFAPVPDDRFHVYGGMSLPREIGADVFVIAGDIHPDRHVRDHVEAVIEAETGLPVVMVLGNHDYYGGDFPSDSGAIHRIGDLRIATATLWTSLSPMDALVQNAMLDFRRIRGISAEAWNDLYHRHVAFLKSAAADVIVTHHAPSSQSIHPRFQGNALNAFFVSNLYVPFEFPGTRLWIHGHTHDAFDYTWDGVRIFCNPWGYPHEALPENPHPPIAIIEV